MLKRRLMLTGCILLTLGLAAISLPAHADDAVGRLQTRADQAFDHGEYMKALPLLWQVEMALKNEPSRLAPIQEKIHVCEIEVFGC